MKPGGINTKMIIELIEKFDPNILKDLKTKSEGEILEKFKKIYQELIDIKDAMISQ